jgi:excisionase family DNA binding protein
MQVATDRPYLNPPAVARLLAVKPAKVLTWIHRGELHAVDVSERRGGRPRWRISQQAFDAFLASRANQKPTAARRRRRRQVEVVEFFA